MLFGAVAWLMAAVEGAEVWSPRQFNVEWLTRTIEPGKDSQGQLTAKGAMPIGNGDVVALVWPNASAGTVEAYVGKQDAQATDQVSGAPAVVGVVHLL